MEQERARILENKEIARDTWRMVLQGAMAAKMEAGQFVNLAIDGFFLRRPISICEVIDDDHFILIYKVVGDGTKKLSELSASQTLDVFGPLGHGYPIEEKEKEVLLIGGGVGVPPLYELAKRYRAIDARVIVVLGFNDADSVFYEDAFRRLGCDVHVATMDGSCGVKGTVIDAIDAAHITTDFVCSCGPLPMLKAVDARYQRGYLSFESRMACGIGACMACIAKDKQEADLYHRICKEGPVFPIGKVAFTWM